MEEYFDVVDENDNVIGKATRRECHSSPSLIHRAVVVFVFNPKNEVLLEKRSMNKDVAPGLWDLVAGHPNPGETYEQAAERELLEEIGIKAIPKKLFPFDNISDVEREKLYAFYVKHNGPFKIDKEEIDFLKFLSLDEIKKSLESEEMKIQPSAKLALEEYFRRFGVKVISS